MVAGASVLELTHTYTQPGFPGVVDEGKKGEKGGDRGNRAQLVEAKSLPQFRGHFLLLLGTRKCSRSQTFPRKLPPGNTSCPSEQCFYTDTLPALGSGRAQLLSVCFGWFETGSNYAAQAGLELGAILPSQAPEGRHYRQRELSRSAEGATLAPPTQVSAASRCWSHTSVPSC